MDQKKTKKFEISNSIFALFQEPISDLRRYDFMDFAQKTADFLLPADLASIYTDIAKQYNSNKSGISGRYYYYLTILVFMLRDVPQAPYIINHYAISSKREDILSKDGDPRSKSLKRFDPMISAVHGIRQKIKYLTLLDAIENYWKTAGAKKTKKMSKEYSEFISLCKKIHRDKMMQRGKVVIADELEKICEFKRSENPKEYGRVRKSFLRFQKKFQAELFKELPWPSEAFDFFLEMLHWRFSESFPGCYVLNNVCDSDVKVNLLKQQAFGAASRNPQGNIPPKAHSRLSHDYKKLNEEYQKQQNEGGGNDELEMALKSTELKLIRQNNPVALRCCHDHEALYSPKERNEILLRRAIWGSPNAAKTMEWKALGFSGLPVELSPRGKHIRTAKLITASGLRCIPAQTHLIRMEFDLLIPERQRKKNEFLNEFCDMSQASDQINFYQAIINNNTSKAQPLIFVHYKIPVTPENFSRLMQNAGIFPPNLIFTVIFEGRLKKQVLLNWNEKLPPPNDTTTDQGITDHADIASNESKQAKGPEEHCPSEPQ